VFTLEMFISGFCQFGWFIRLNTSREPEIAFSVAQPGNDIGQELAGRQLPIIASHDDPPALNKRSKHREPVAFLQGVEEHLIAQSHAKRRSHTSPPFSTAGLGFQQLSCVENIQEPNRDPLHGSSSPSTRPQSGASRAFFFGL
jgi:hypothetical protein